jgi:hypothetical protein
MCEPSALTSSYMGNKATQEKSVEAQEHAKDCRFSSVTVYPFSSRDSLKPLAGAICARMLFGLTDLLHVSVLFFFSIRSMGKKKKTLGSKTGPGWSFFFSPGLRGKVSLSHEATMTASDLPPPIFSRMIFCEVFGLLVLVCRVVCWRPRDADGGDCPGLVGDCVVS